MLSNMNFFRKKTVFIVVFIVVLLVTASVYVYRTYIEDIDMSEPAPPKNELILAIIHDGDIESYNMLSRYYHAEILPYAFFMANEHNYGRACFDVYGSIISIYTLEKNINEESCKIAMSYLKKGADIGDISCIMGMYYELASGRIIQQDSTLAFHYAYILYKDSTTAEQFVSSGMYVGKRIKQIRE